MQEQDENHRIISATTISSSPFPSPDVLERYNKVKPELVDRVFNYIEKNSEKRWELEKELVNNQKTIIDNSHTRNMQKIKQQGKGQNIFVCGI